MRGLEPEAVVVVSVVEPETSVMVSIIEAAAIIVASAVESEAVGRGAGVAHVVARQMPCNRYEYVSMAFAALIRNKAGFHHFGVAAVGAYK